MSDETRAALRAAGSEFKAARAALDEARERLVPLLVKALQDGGIKQRELVELSGYTRESVRTLARRNGVAAD